MILYFYLQSYLSPFNALWMIRHKVYILSKVYAGRIKSET